LGRASRPAVRHKAFAVGRFDVADGLVAQKSVGCVCAAGATHHRAADRCVGRRIRDGQTHPTH